MPELTKRQAANRFKNRRRMAWWSFFLIIITGLGLLGAGLYSDEYANRIDTLSFIVGGLFGVWGGIVLAYFGASAYQDTSDLKYDLRTVDDDFYSSPYRSPSMGYRQDMYGPTMPANMSPDRPFYDGE